MTKGILFIIVLILISTISCNNKPKTAHTHLGLGYQFEKIDLPYKVSIRGLSVISDSTWWISGSDGTAAFIDFTNNQLRSHALQGYANKDFRDIYGWNNNEAITLSVGDSAIVLKTSDQWQNTNLAYEDNSAGVFLDAIDFENDYGIIFGDSRDGVLEILESNDRGNSWQKLSNAVLPKALVNEGGFAASGTNVDVIEGIVYIGSGAGPFPRMIKKGVDNQWKAQAIPLQNGPMSGSYSIVFKNKVEGIAIGGSFMDSTRIDSVIAYTVDGGENWTLPLQGPDGFRSCAAYSPIHNIYLVTGRTGIDYSYDGLIWHSISKESGYYACAFGTKSAILVGRGGKCAKITFFQKQ